MYGSKLSWIVPIIVLFVLITVIVVGIKQNKSDGTVGIINNSAVSSYVE